MVLPRLQSGRVGRSVRVRVRVIDELTISTTTFVPGAAGGGFHVFELMGLDFVAWVQELFLVDNVMPVYACEEGAEVMVLAVESVHDVLDLLCVETSVIDDCAVGVIGSEDTVGTEVSYAIGIVI